MRRSSWVFLEVIWNEILRDVKNPFTHLLEEFFQDKGVKFVFIDDGLMFFELKNKLESGEDISKISSMCFWSTILLEFFDFLKPRFETTKIDK